MRKWFKDVETVEELRAVYKELLKRYHPDNGGDLSAMQEINAEYEAVFAVLKCQDKPDTECSDEEAKEDTVLRKILNQIAGYNMDVEIIGSWIWCFNSYAYRDRLKALGFKFAPKKKAWAWHYGEYKRFGKEKDLDDIRAKYGSQKVTRRSKQYSLD